MSDMRSVIAVTLDLHTTKVDMDWRDLVQCSCGRYCKRGPNAKAEVNLHIEDALVEAFLAPEVPLA